MKNNYAFQKLSMLLVLFIFGSISVNAQENDRGIFSNKAYSILPAPKGLSKIQMPASASDNLFRGEIAYGDNLQSARFYSFDIDNPANITEIGPTDYMAFCGDFTNDDPDNMWMIR